MQAQAQSIIGTLSPIAIFFFLAFVAVTLGITYWAAKKTKSAAQFYAAGGGITGFQNGLALAGDQFVYGDLGNKMPVREDLIRVQLQFLRHFPDSARRQAIIDRLCFSHGSLIAARRGPTPACLCRKGICPLVMYS